MTSHASVNVMLALEDGVRRRVPGRDAQARACSRASSSIARRARAARRGGAHDASRVDRDQAFLDAIRRIADEVAAPNADDVDREARFPPETIDALREERRAGRLRPRRARRRRRLASRRSPRRASSSAAAAARARWSSRCTRSRSRRSCATSTARRGSRTTCARSPRDQRLVASVTSEVGTGGDIGRSIAAVTPAGDGRCDVREAGPDGVATARYADDLLTTLRRAPDAEPGDQVVVAHRAATSTTLEQTGHVGSARACAARARRATSSAPSSRPSRSCRRRSRASRPSRWCRSRTSCGRTSGSGIATDAFDRARAFVARRGQAAARTQPPPTAHAPVAPHERAVAAARRGRARRCATSSRPSPSRDRERLVDDGARSCASTTSRSPPPSRRRASARARSASAASSASRTTRRSASAGTCATRCRPA